MFETFNATTAEVLVRPWASVARAATQCSPSGTVLLSQVRWYGAAVSDDVPTGTPSTTNSSAPTPVTGDVAVRPTAPLAKAPWAGAVIVTAGGVVSGWSTVPVVTLLRRR